MTTKTPEKFHVLLTPSSKQEYIRSVIKDKAIIKYIEGPSGKPMKVYSLRIQMDLEKEMEQLERDRETIEFQAAYIIYEKYKRTHDLNLNNLFRRSKVLAETRRQKKEPNVDYLTQALSDYVKTL